MKKAVITLSMNPNNLNLLLRSLKDVQAQADRILSGEKSHETIRNFAVYSIELKRYINENINDDNIICYLSQIPDINHTRTEIKLWQFLILPAWWFNLYKNYIAKEKSVAEVRTTREKYANIEIMLKDTSI